MIWGTITVVIGLILAYAGYRILKAKDPEYPKGTVVFAGVWPHPVWLWHILGQGLLMIGLMLTMIIGPFFFIAAR